MDNSKLYGVDVQDVLGGLYKDREFTFPNGEVISLLGYDSEVKESTISTELKEIYADGYLLPEQDIVKFLLSFEKKWITPQYTQDGRKVYLNPTGFIPLSNVISGLYREDLGFELNSVNSVIPYDSSSAFQYEGLAQLTQKFDSCLGLVAHDGFLGEYKTSILELGIILLNHPASYSETILLNQGYSNLDIKCLVDYTHSRQRIEPLSQDMLMKVLESYSKNLYTKEQIRFIGQQKYPSISEDVPYIETLRADLGGKYDIRLIPIEYFIFAVELLKFFNKNHKSPAEMLKALTRDEFCSLMIYLTGTKEGGF